MRFKKRKKPHVTLFVGLSVFGWGIYHITCCSSEAICALCLKIPLDKRGIKMPVLFHCFEWYRHADIHILITK